MLSISRHHRLHTIFVITLALVPMVFVAGTNYIVDPFQIYRRQCWVEPIFWNNQRTQNAGKIRSYLAQDGYDSIILGNSVADNFRPSRVAKYLGWEKTMKLTVNGGTGAEQAYTLEQALQHNAPIKNVLWCIRAINFADIETDNSPPNQPMPFYLYTQSLFDDFPYLFNIDSVIFSKNLLLGTSKWIQDLDILNYWQSKKHIVKQIDYNSPKNLSKLSRRKNVKEYNLNTNMDLNFPNIDNNLIRFIKKHQKIQFAIIIAPVTRQSIAYKHKKTLIKYLSVQHYLVNATKDLPNVKIFGFENVDTIVNNLANYRDAIHYHSGVNEYMIKAVSQGNNRLTVNNIDEYISEITNKLGTFKIYSDFKTMIPLALQEENMILDHTLDIKPMKDNLE